MSSFFKPNIEKLTRKKDINSLIKALAYKRDNNIQKSALIAIEELSENISDLKPIISALHNKNKIIRDHILGFLDKFLSPKLDHWPIYYKENFENIDGHSLFIDLLKSEDPEIKYFILKMIQKMKELIYFDSLLLSLKDESPLVRKEAVVSLRNFEDIDIVEILIELLNDTDSDVKFETLMLLQKTKDKTNRVVSPLLDMLKKPNEEKVSNSLLPYNN